MVALNAIKFTAGASLLALCFASPALCQSSATAAAPADTSAAAEGDAQGAEIIVTAQKRLERLVDVPISITTASGDQLAKQGIKSAEDLSRLVPGFSFTATSFGTPIFVLRGIGFDDVTIGGAPAVGIYVDQVPLPYSVQARGATLDLERLEALKGPQGTLFGQSTTGGAINYIAAKPTETTHSGFDLSYGRFNTVDAGGFLSGKIAPNLTARVAGRYEYGDGWQKEYLPNSAQFGAKAGDRLGARKFATGRLLVDWKPSDTVSFEFGANGWIDKSETLAQQFVLLSPQTALNPFNAPTYAALATLSPSPAKSRLAGWDPGRDYARDDNFYQLSLHGDVELGDIGTLTSITAYSRYKENSPVDYDGSGFNDLFLVRHGDIKSFSQELRLAGSVGQLRWMVGGNFAHDKTAEIQANQIHNTNNGIGPLRYVFFNSENQQNVKTYAGFGSLEYAINDQLTVQGSARYTKQDRSYAGCLRDSGDGKLATAFSVLSSQLSGSPTVITPGSCVTLNDNPANTAVGLFKPVPILNLALNEDNVSFRGSVNYKPNPDSLIYVSIAKGYKPGSFTIPPLALASQETPVTQESVIAYEVGTKLSLAHRRVQISAAAFYYDYTDKQLFGSANVPVFNNLPKLINIPKSRVVGGELEVLLRPVTGLRVTAGVTYVGSKVKKDPVAPNTPLNPVGTPTSYIGEGFPGTPDWQGVLDAEYSFKIGSGDTSLFFGGSLNSRSGTYGQFGEFAAVRIPGYTLVDLRGGVELEGGKLRLQVWGRNVGNKYYINGVRRAGDQIARFAGMPATYGVTLGFRY